MKTEERHRLHEHELRKLTLRAGEFWKQHGMKVLAAVLGVVVIAVAALIWVASSQSAAAEGWTRMAQSASSEQFIAIAEDYAGEAVGDWARLRAAEIHLREGVQQAFSNRGAAVDEIEESVAQFSKLLSADLPSDKLHERGLYGHARALEALASVSEPSDGQTKARLEDAIAAYEKLLKTFPDTIYQPLVEEQIKSLKAERTQQFVTWFRQQDPKPSDRATPQDGLPSDPGASSGAGPDLGGAIVPPTTSGGATPGAPTETPSAGTAPPASESGDQTPTPAEAPMNDSAPADNANAPPPVVPENGETGAAPAADSGATPSPAGSEQPAPADRP